MIFERHEGDDSKIPIVIGNPPYDRTGKRDEYRYLDMWVKDSYSYAPSKNKSSLYSDYIRALRVGTDIVTHWGRGILCHVLPFGFLESQAGGGIRKDLYETFERIYIIHLGGGKTGSEDERREEGGNVFGKNGTKSSVAILICEKLGGQNDTQQTVTSNADGQRIYKKIKEIGYHHIGLNMSTKDKLSRLSSLGSIQRVFHIFNDEKRRYGFDPIIPDKYGDWFNQRDPFFDSLVSLQKTSQDHERHLFECSSLGVTTGMDQWLISPSREQLESNVKALIKEQNRQVKKLKTYKRPLDPKELENDGDIKLSEHLLYNVAKGKKSAFDIGHVVKCTYRPFVDRYLYADDLLNARMYAMNRIFPPHGKDNIAITSTAPNSQHIWNAFIIKRPLVAGGLIGRIFPLYYYDQQGVRQDNISDELLRYLQEAYNDIYLVKEQVFYYVYGVLSNKKFKETFKASLLKGNTRIPMVKSFGLFRDFVGYGQRLAEAHLSYDENLDSAYDFIRSVGLEVEHDHRHVYERIQDPDTYFKLDKMVLNSHMSRIEYNKKISIVGDFSKISNLMLGYKTAFKWIVDQQACRSDSETGIVSDPNEWSSDPEYNLKLLCSVLRLCFKTQEINNVMCPPLPLDPNDLLSMRKEDDKKRKII